MTNSVVSNEITFKSPDDIELFERSWILSGARAVILITHGIAEHSGRYTHLAQALNNANYSVIAFDLRGHGQSSGKRNYISSFQDYLDDLGAVLERTRKASSNKPVFLCGHSMGGGIVTQYIIERNPQVNGAILSAPSVKVSDDISPFLQKISGILSVLTPTLPAVKIDSSFISKDPQVVAAYDSDPLNYRGGVLARTGAELLKSTRQINKSMPAFSLPVLIMHGLQDKLADVAGSQILYEQISSKDKTLKLYEGLYHEIFNEPEKDQVIREMIEWLNNHTA